VSSYVVSHKFVVADDPRSPVTGQGSVVDDQDQRRETASADEVLSRVKRSSLAEAKQGIGARSNEGMLTLCATNAVIGQWS
jgi:hypothetical protein